MFHARFAAGTKGGRNTMSLSGKQRPAPLQPDEDTGEVLARLLLAAQEDKAFRDQVLNILRLPLVQRQSIVNNALHEMTLRGEPMAMRQAFAVLATEEGAATARNILHDQ